MRKKFTVLLAIAGTLCITHAQESAVYTHDQKTYQDALALYNNKQYQAAQTLFEKVLQQTSDPETKANSACSTIPHLRKAEFGLYGCCRLLF